MERFPQGWRRAVVAGLVATAGMSLLLALLPLAGFPSIDVPALIVAPLIGRMPPPWSAWWWIGNAVHFALGAGVFPVVLLIGAATVPRMSFPLLSWLLAMALFLIGEGIVTPLTGGGLFSSRSPRFELVVAADFLSHTLYGVVLGLLARPLRP